MIDKNLSLNNMLEREDLLALPLSKWKELLIEKYKGYMDLLTDTTFEGNIKGLGVVILKKQ